MSSEKIAFVSTLIFYVIRMALAGHAPSPSRGGLGRGWGFPLILPLKHPIPLLTSPLKGEEQSTARI